MLKRKSRRILLFIPILLTSQRFGHDVRRLHSSPELVRIRSKTHTFSLNQQMRVIVRWTCAAMCEELDVRLARFRRVLRAAQRTSGYQPLLESAVLSTTRALASVTSVEGTLERLPAIELDEFRGSPGAFESPGGFRP